MLPIQRLYYILRERFGFQGWWPGESQDEIVIGAMLAQQSSWKNVEKALGNLKLAGMLGLKAIAASSIGDIERRIRPSGFYRQKARRLRGLARHVFSRHGSLAGMLKSEPRGLREELLSMDGIGKETADAILLYAAGRRFFVIDAYTRRIMARVYGLGREPGYDELQALISSAIRRDTRLYKDFHAQLVELGKSHCRAKPLCSKCPVKSYCIYYRSEPVHG